MFEAPEHVGLQNRRRRITRLRTLHMVLANEQVDQLLSIQYAARIPLESQTIDADVLERSHQVLHEATSPVHRKISLPNMIRLVKEMSETEDDGFVVLDWQRRQVDYVAIGARSGASDTDLHSHLVP